MTHSRRKALSQLLWLAAIVLLAGFHCIPVAAQAQPWDGAAFSASPATVLSAAGSVKVDPDIPVTLFLESRSIQIDSQHRLKETLYRVYRLNSPEAAKAWAATGSQWSPWRQDRPEIRARVITPDGVAHDLDTKVLSEAPAHDERPVVYNDNRIYSGPLPAITSGAIVEEEISVNDTAPLFSAGVVHSVYFGRKLPVLHSLLTIEYPESLPFKYTVHLLPDLKTTKQTDNGMVHLVFDQAEMKEVEESEPYLPDDVESWPVIEFSTAPSWSAVVAAYDKSVDSKIRPEEVQSYLPGNRPKSRDELILQLVETLHKQVRYTGIEFGEAGLIPQSTAETLEHKYGDCKDKSATLVAMLRAVGIPAHLALLSVRPYKETDPELPGFGNFDHAIVYIPGKTPLWIDATAEFAKPGNLPWPDQGRLALVVDKNTTTLVRTPVDQSSDNLLVEKREFYLSEYGPARIVEISYPNGALDRQYRSSYGQEETKEIHDELDRYVQSAYLADKMTSFEHTSGADLARPFELRIEVEKGKRGFTDLDDAIVAIRPEGLISRLPEFLHTEEADEKKAANSKIVDRHRAHDLFMQPFITEWRYKIVLPPGFQLAALPQNRKLSMGPAQLTQEYRKEQDGTVTAIWRFDSVKSRFTPAEIQALRHDVSEFRKSDALLIRFDQTGYALLSAGKVREALQAYRDLSKLHPKESLHRVQIAYALLQAGFGEEARAEAQNAVTLDPNSALAQETLGWILEFDLIGRRFEKGFDLNGAIAADRKAKELDSKNTNVRADLAILLEHDSNGVRYSSAAALDQAIAEYRELKQVDKDAGEKFDENLLLDLLYAQHWQEAIDFASTLAESATRQAVLVSAKAAASGPAAAIEESNRLASGESARTKMQEDAARLLLRMRRYPDAVALLKAAASGQENTAEANAEIEMYSKTHPYESILLPESDVRGIVQRYFAAMFDPEADPDKAAQYVEADVDNPNDAENARRTIVAIRKSTQSEFPGKRAPDVIVSNFSFAVEGNDALGYRVRSHSIGGQTQTILLAKRNNGYRIFAIDRASILAGHEILRKIDTGDLAGAKQWLDWVREEKKLEAGDDPLSGYVFPRFWTRGDDPNPVKMKLAAYALLSMSPAIKKYVPELEAALTAATADSDRQHLNLLLARTYWELEDWPNLKKYSAVLLTANPTSDTAFEMLTSAENHLSDWDGWDKTISGRLARLPDDLLALRSRGRLYAMQSKYAKSREIDKLLIDSGRAEAEDLNMYAWEALFTGKVTDDDISFAQRASKLTKGESYAILHTLACLYAEIGKGKEARELLLQAMDSGGLESPDSSIWYGFGRIAEAYGLTDSALSDYKRVEKPSHGSDPTSCYALAEPRMHALSDGLKAPIKSRQ